ncbi:MAG: class I SAM-dependent methyltransferase [Nitrospirota bacterium]|nr:MAG: class I SAM-dependent methyltransferase [Nitrospirota bacterium]
MNNIAEHYIPVNKDHYLTAQHWERYLFALSLLKPGMKVLDIACGIGYGTEIIRQYGCDVTGVDYDKDLIEESRSIWKYDGFVNADALDLPFEDSSFDAIVSYETIEHVNDGDRYLSELRRVLRSSGIIICSTPNIKYASHPPFHLKEYGVDEFFYLIGKKFSEIQCYAQYFRITDRISDIAQWYMIPFIGSIMNKLGIKDAIMSLLGRRPTDHKTMQSINGAKGSTIIEQLKGEEGKSYYEVRPFKGPRMLRVMVAVARKKDMS